MPNNPLDQFAVGQSVKVTLVKSTNKALQRHKAGVRTLGLRKIGQSRELVWNLVTRGIVQHCIHLLKVEGVQA